MLSVTDLRCEPFPAPAEPRPTRLDRRVLLLARARVQRVFSVSQRIRGGPIVAVPLVLIASAMSTYVQSRNRPIGNPQNEILQLRQGPPSPPPLLLRPLPPSEAVAINRSIPIAPGPNPPALPFRFHGSAAAYDRALNCLTSAVYYEAATESDEGQQAVAQVVLNRVRHPAFPASICAVVYQGSTLPTGCQFSFTCDGSLNRGRATREWARSQAAAAAALAGRVFAPVGNATHYHADFVVPYWATSLDKNQVVGAHIFYRWRGAWGKAAAFRRAYPAAEADPVLLRAIALAARQPAVPPIQPAQREPQVSVSANPRVELFNIVRMLAFAPAEGEQSAFEKDAREYFAKFSDHLAVQIYRQLASDGGPLASDVIAQLVQGPAGTDDIEKAPALTLPGRPPEAAAGFAEALADFASHAKFTEFFAKQQLHYLAQGDAYRAVATPVASRFENYLGAGAGSLRMIVAAGVKKPFVIDCSPSPLMVVPQAALDSEGKPSAGGAETEAVLAHAIARRAVDRDRHCGANAKADARADQIASILASRVMRPALATDKPKRDQGPAAAIADALDTYERNRKWFTTFDSFRPALFQTLALGDAPRSVCTSKNRPVSPATGRCSEATKS